MRGTLGSVAGNPRLTEARVAQSSKIPNGSGNAPLGLWRHDSACAGTRSARCRAGEITALRQAVTGCGDNFARSAMPGVTFLFCLG